MEWDLLIQHPSFENYMKLYKFKQFRIIIPKIYEQGQLKDNNTWCLFKDSFDDFNIIRRVSNKCCF